jgi:hypothetical protein
MMLDKYEGINPASCGPLLLLKAADIMVEGGYLKNGGTKNVCGNSYCLQRN